MDLSLVSIDEIFTEINKRFDIVLVLTQKYLGKNAKGEAIENINYHVKNKVGCLGLMRIADEGLKNSYKTAQTDGFVDE